MKSGLFLLCLLVLTVLTGCAGTKDGTKEPRDILREQGKKDLRCDDFVLVRDMELRPEVRGCGRTVIYERWCVLEADGRAGQCQFVRAGTASASRGH
jgi:hypothetical protein